VTIRLKRAYEPPQRGDGLRVLVDRLWPRGVSKARARIDHWLKEIAPSTALRKWFHHDPGRWQEFVNRYLRELEENPAAVDELRALARRGTVTLVFSAKDEQRNQAVVLRDYLAASRQRTPGKRRP
jgi:uncharacterized protein YeaO (DUF488 family)